MPGVRTALSRFAPVRPTVLLLGLLALVPAAFIAMRVADATRNVAYWDEFDTALSLVLQLDSGLDAPEFIDRLFKVSNEHRMVTSRLMFAASYWLTGTINFSAINWIGNASLVLLCALLVFQMETAARRVRMALLLGMVMFQLEHYENFLWSGSSIDHFQVVLLAAGAVVGVARGSRTALLIGMLCALLATFTLAHGMVAWFVGAALLAYQRRWAHLGIWSGLGVLALAGFFAGFHLNTGQRFVEPTLAGLWQILHFWLSLLGAAPALGNLAVAPWLGVVLLGLLGWAAGRGALRREPVAFPLACFALAALALIALGRAAEAGGAMHSRYFVLDALAWGLAAFMAMSRVSHPKRPYRLLWAALPALAAFNVAANHVFTRAADSWIECRDRAALRYKREGVDGRGPFTLHPVPAWSTALLNEAERRGIYRMAPVCEVRSFPDAQPTQRISYFVDEMTVDSRAAYIDGWAAIPGEIARRGQVHLVLRSPDATHVFSTVTITRPDVAKATQHPDWELCGFRFVRRRDRLPSGDFQVGVLIDDGDTPEYIMTAHRMTLIGDGKALLATGD